MAGEFIELRGVEGFLKVSKALKRAGETELRKGLHKGMRDAVAKHKPKAEAVLASVLPSRMADRSKVRQAVRVRTGAKPGVSVVVPYGKRPRNGLSAANARMLNIRGMFRHPVLADLDLPRDSWQWVNQIAPGTAGWFDDTWADATPEVRRQLEQEVRAVLDQIVREAR